MKKNIALVAHDACKEKLMTFVKENLNFYKRQNLYATNTTGTLLENDFDLSVTKLLSGPYGGDQQIGALIAEKKIDSVLFFWDPLSAHPHEDDVKALLRIATLWNVPVACNEATARLMVTPVLQNYANETIKPIYYNETAIF